MSRKSQRAQPRKGTKWFSNEKNVGKEKGKSDHGKKVIKGKMETRGKEKGKKKTKFPTQPRCDGRKGDLGMLKIAYDASKRGKNGPNAG